MSWLDLPPDPNAQVMSLSQASAKSEMGFAKVLLSLVGSGLIGVASELGLEIWKPDDPARLASILGVGIVERADAQDGFAECGHLDAAKGILYVRHRNPYEGKPRTFTVRQNTFPDPRLDAWGRWQIERMADSTLRGGEPWSIHEAGFGRATVNLTFTTAGPKMVLEACPAHLADEWGSTQAGRVRGSDGAATRTRFLARTPRDVQEAARLITVAMEEAGLRPWEVMPTWARP